MLRSSTGWSKSEEDQTKGVSYMQSREIGLEEPCLFLRVKTHEEHGSSAYTAYSKLGKDSFMVLSRQVLPVYRQPEIRWSKTDQLPKYSRISWATDSVTHFVTWPLDGGYSTNKYCTSCSVEFDYRCVNCILNCPQWYRLESSSC
jgi:hypothetical protein